MEQFQKLLQFLKTLHKFPEAKKGKKVLRTKQCLTFRELAPRLEISYSYLSQIESGTRTPNAEMIVKIADVFGVCIDRLMRDEMELADNEEE